MSLVRNARATIGSVLSAKTTVEARPATTAGLIGLGDATRRRVAPPGADSG